MYTLSHDPSSDTQPSSEVTIETKRHRSAEVDTVFTSARCGADVTGAPSRATYRPSKSCSSASQPSESNCVTGTPGNCVAGYSSIDISSSLLSCASTCVSGTNMIDVHVNRSNEHSRAPVRACMYRARRGDVARENARKFVAKSPFQAAATMIIV